MQGQISNLKQAYKDAKSNNSQTGRGAKTSPFFDVFYGEKLCHGEGYREGWEGSKTWGLWDNVFKMAEENFQGFTKAENRPFHQDVKL